MKKSFFSLIVAAVLFTSTVAYAASPLFVVGYDSPPTLVLVTMDRPATPVPTVADTSHRVYSSVAGVVANWQPGGDGNGGAGYVLLANCGEVGGYTEVGWPRSIG